MKYFKEYLVQLFSGETDQHISDVPQEYILNQKVCDFAETVHWWTKNEQYSAKKISADSFSL